MQGNQKVRDNIVIATKFAAYPWRLTPNQFVEACKYAPSWISRAFFVTKSKLLQSLYKNPYSYLPWPNNQTYILIFRSCTYLLDSGFRSSIDRVQLDQMGIGQLHWSTANYNPLQERALWDGLVAMYDKVTMNLFCSTYQAIEIYVSFSCNDFLLHFVKFLHIVMSPNLFNFTSPRKITWYRD